MSSGYTGDCWFSGVRGDNRSVFHCYVGGQHSFNILFDGAAIYWHGRGSEPETCEVTEQGLQDNGFARYSAGCPTGPIEVLLNYIPPGG